MKLTIFLRASIDLIRSCGLIFCFTFFNWIDHKQCAAQFSRDSSKHLPKTRSRMELLYCHRKKLYKQKKFHVSGVYMKWSNKSIDTNITWSSQIFRVTFVYDFSGCCECDQHKSKKKKKSWASNKKSIECDHFICTIQFRVFSRQNRNLIIKLYENIYSIYIEYA